MLEKSLCIESPSNHRVRLGYFLCPVFLDVVLVECIIKGFQDGKSIFRGGPNSCFFLTSSLPNQNKGDLNPSSSSSSNENIEGFNKKGHQN